MIAYRTTVHEMYSQSVMLGRETYPPIGISAGTTLTNSQEICCYHSDVEFRNTMEITYGIVNENLQSSLKKQKRYHDIWLKLRAFAKDDLVWRWYPPKTKQD